MPHPDPVHVAFCRLTWRKLLQRILEQFSDKLLGQGHDDKGEIDGEKGVEKILGNEPRRNDANGIIR